MVKSFDSWKKRKLLVLKMITSSDLVESSLTALGIPCEVYDCVEDSDVDKKWQSHKDEFCGAIITGSLTNKDLHMEPSMPIEILQEVPVLGICYGHEFIGKYLGAQVVDCNPPVGEHGASQVTFYEDTLFKGLNINQEWIVTMQHDRMLKELPEGAKLIASTEMTPISGFHHEEKNLWGIQFHPEKDWLKDAIFKNFYKFCYEVL